MKARFLPPPLLLTLSILTVVGSGVSAQTGNDNITGPTGIFNGDVATAGDYDPYTANARRAVTDIIVAGSAGTQPLALVRTFNSRSANLSDFGIGWTHNYKWQLGGVPGQSLTQDFQPTSYGVTFPDGRIETFAPPADGAGAWHASKGIVERFLPLNLSTMKAYLLLSDGSKVEFTATESNYQFPCNPGQDGSPMCTWYRYTYTPTAIYDPYGQITTLTYNSYGLRVTEPAGRALQFVMGTVNGTSVIDHVNASDGRTVQYHYVSTAVPGATYGYTHLDSVTYYGDTTGNLVAHYTYQIPNAGLGANGYPLLRTCIDPMYAGPTWRIAYRYQSTNNSDGSMPVYGQIQSENYYSGTADNGGTLSTLSVDNAHNTRTEKRGDGPGGIGPSRTFTYGGTYGNITYPANLLTRATDFKGMPGWQSYDLSTNYINSMTDRNLRTTGYTTNPITGRPTVIQFPATPGDGPATGGTLKYTYSGGTGCDAANNDASNPYYVCTSTDEASNVTKYTRVGGAGINKKRILNIYYPDGGVEGFNYDNYGHVTLHYLPTGGYELYTYYYSPPNGSDPTYLNGLVKEYRDPYHDPIGKTGNATARYQYDSHSRLYSVTDALGSSVGDPAHTTIYTPYNARDQVSAITLPTDPKDGTHHTVLKNYNLKDGTLASVTDQLSHITSYTYDDYKRLLTAQTPVRGNGDNSVNTTTYSYLRPGTTSPYLHTANFPFRITSPAQRVINNDSDNNFRKLTITVGTGAEAAKTNFVYDNVGNITAVGLPDEQAGQPYYGYWATTNYDERNRPSLKADQLGLPTYFTYDAGGRKKTITRANGQVITFNSYDEMNRLLQQTVTQDPNPAAVTKYNYDPAGGQLQTMTDPDGKVYTYDYDLMNRKAKLTYPLGTTESWTYNNAGTGLLQQFKNRADKKETFTYDNLDRVTLSHWDDGLTPDITTIYDAANRVTSVINSNSTITRAYYNDNLLYTETNKYGDNINRTVTYTYDPDGRRASLKYPNNGVHWGQV